MARGRKRSRVIDDEAEEGGGEGEEEEEGEGDGYFEGEGDGEEEEAPERRENEGEKAVKRGSSQSRGLSQSRESSQGRGGKLGGKWTQRGARLPRVVKDTRPPSSQKSGTATIHSFFKPRSTASGETHSSSTSQERVDAAQDHSRPQGAPPFPPKTKAKASPPSSLSQPPPKSKPPPPSSQSQPYPKSRATPPPGDSQRGAASLRLLELAEDCGFSREAAEACLARMEGDQEQLRGAGGPRDEAGLRTRGSGGRGDGEGGAGEWLGPMSVDTWGDEFLGILADWSSQAVPPDVAANGTLGTPAKGKGSALGAWPEGQASPPPPLGATQAEDFDLEAPIDDDVMFLGEEAGEWYTGDGAGVGGAPPSAASFISHLRRSEAALGSADAERPWKQPASVSGSFHSTSMAPRSPAAGPQADPFMSPPPPTSSLATGAGPGSLASELSRHRTLPRTHASGAERDPLSGRAGELRQGASHGLLGLKPAAPPTAGSAVCHRTASRTAREAAAPSPHQRHQNPQRQQQQGQGQGQQGQGLWRVPGVPGAPRLLYHEAVAMDQLELGNAAVFGHRSFRARQREACEAALAGHDCFVLMPTGGGKSLCYQLPAILSPGVSVVVSPLLSLIQDQVMALVHAFRLPAAFLSSQLTLAQTHTVMRELRKQRPTCKLLYVTPEKVVGSPAFQNVLRDLANKGLLARFVIDEAHCISDWGHDFRPEYSQLSMLRTLFPSVPIMALTATATPHVRESILSTLNIPLATVIQLSFDRTNIAYEVQEKDPQDPLGHLADVIDRRFHRQSGIVYCLSKSETETVAGMLRKGAPDAHGKPRTRPVRAQAYHAGMPGARRALVQGAWKAGEVDVICATIAFGMGIDKPDVRFVIHNSMSKAVEAFYQESGRAGRDGAPATSLVLYGPRDMSRIVCLLRLSGGRGGQSRSSRRSRFHHDLQRAKQMQAYCQDKDKCRRWVLLNHFGEVFDPPHCKPGSSHCDICRAKPS